MRLAHIEGITVAVHGRHDLGSPVRTAWELAKAWPDAQLGIIEDAGHAGERHARPDGPDGDRGVQRPLMRGS